MNSKGQIMITDLLLYLLIITILLGMVVYLMATLNNNEVTNVNNHELNNMLSDATRVLTTTSGSPDYWEDLNNMANTKTVGLKSRHNSLISYDKLIKLKSNPHLLDTFFPEGVSYSLTFYPKNRTSSSQLIAGKSSLSNYNHIQSKEVPILIDYGYNVTLVNSSYKCPLNHNKYWKCIAFTVNSSLLEDGEFYIVTDDNCRYIISNTYLDNITGQTNRIISINNKLDDLKVNDNQTYYLHLNTNNNASYLVYDANDREEFLDNVLRPEVYILNMKVAA